MTDGKVEVRMIDSAEGRAIPNQRLTVRQLEGSVGLLDVLQAPLAEMRPRVA